MSCEINLYDVRLRPRRELVCGRNLAALSLLLLLLVGGWAWLARSEEKQRAAEAAAGAKQVAASNEALSTLTEALNARRLPPALVAELDEAKARLAAGQELLDLLSSGKSGRIEGFSGFMIGFSRLARQELWLTGFQISNGGEEIEIHGRLFDPVHLPAYVQQLNSVPVFQGRRFAALDLKKVTAEKSPEPAPSSAKDAAPGTAPSPVPFVEFVLRSTDAERKEGK